MKKKMTGKKKARSKAVKLEKDIKIKDLFGRKSFVKLPFLFGNTVFIGV